MNTTHCRYAHLGPNSMLTLKDIGAPEACVEEAEIFNICLCKRITYPPSHI